MCISAGLAISPATKQAISSTSQLVTSTGGFLTLPCLQRLLQRLLYCLCSPSRSLFCGMPCTVIQPRLCHLAATQSTQRLPAGGTISPASSEQSPFDASLAVPASTGGALALPCN